MNEFYTVLSAVLPVFCLAIVGVVLRKVEWLTEEADASLMRVDVAYVLSNKGYQICGNDTIFGYHELFHTATLFSAYFVYMVNYTIARAQSPSAPISVASLTQFTEN